VCVCVCVCVCVVIQVDYFYIQRSTRRRRHSSTTSVSGIEFYNHVQQSLETQNQLLDLSLQIEKRADNKTITTAGITHHGQLIRMDSNPQGHKEQQLVKEDFEFVFEATGVDLMPGDNKVDLCGQVHVSYLIRQLN